MVGSIAIAAGVAVVAGISDEPGRSVRVFLTGSLDGVFQIGTTLGRSIPYIFTGAAFAIAARSGAFNIGIEGQLYMGAVAGSALVLRVGGPGPLIIVAACLAAAAAGGVWGFLPGWVRARYGANEIVLTLMLNFVAVLFVSWLIADHLADPGRPGFPQSELIPPTARLPRLLPPSSLHVGIIIGIVVCVVAHLGLSRTTQGYELRMAGENPEFARYTGLRPDFTLILGMTVSGAVGGLAGVVHILGQEHRLIDGFSPGYGFFGILIALLARNHLLAVPAAAMFYGWIISGAQVMEERTDVAREAVSVVQGVLFLLVTAAVLVTWLRRRRASRAFLHGPSL